jgi:hypothetical protein
MTPEQALKLIDDTLANINTNRQSHALLQKAISVLNSAISSQKAPDSSTANAS